MEIIATVKEHEAHMVMTNCLPKGTSGSDKIGGESVYFAGKQQKQGEYEGQCQKQRLTRETQKGKMVSDSVVGVQAMLQQSASLTCHRKLKIISSQAQLMSQEKTNQTNW